MADVEFGDVWPVDIQWTLAYSARIYAYPFSFFHSALVDSEGFTAFFGCVLLSIVAPLARFSQWNGFRFRPVEWAAGGY